MSPNRVTPHYPPCPVHPYATPPHAPYYAPHPDHPGSGTRRTDSSSSADVYPFHSRDAIETHIPGETRPS